MIVYDGFITLLLSFPHLLISPINTQPKWKINQISYLKTRRHKNGLPCGSSGEEFACRKCRFNPWVRRIPWRRKWQPLQYSGLENSVDRGDWWATVQRVAKSQSLTHTHKHTHTHLTISDENVFAIIVILVYIMLSLTNS